MMKIILRASTTLVVAWIVLFTGVNSVNISAVDSTTESTDASTPHSLTSVLMDLRITNRVYNDSLADQQSAEYSTLKQEVDELFADIYALSFNHTHLIYLGTDEMIFSNGSVIATSRLLFGPTQVNPEIVRGIFLPAYKLISSPALEIDLSYIDNELPTEDPFEEENASRPPMTTHEETTPFMATPLTSTPDIIMDAKSSTSHPPSTHTPNISTSVVVENVTSAVYSTTSTPFNTTSMQPNTTTNLMMNNTSTFAAPSSTTSAETNGTVAEAPNGTTTAAPIGTISTSMTTTASTGTTTDTITTVPNAITTATPNGTTTPTALKTTFSSTLNTVVNPTMSSTPFPKTQPTKTTPMNYSPTTIADLVPGWAVALLALTGVSLFLLIILIILVVFWCCCPKRRVFVNEPEEMNPPMYFSPDIPMYSTQSTFDTANGKQTDVREKPPKNRTGMYVVNK